MRAGQVSRAARAVLATAALASVALGLQHSCTSGGAARGGGDVGDVACEAALAAAAGAAHQGTCEAPAGAGSPFPEQLSQECVAAAGWIASCGLIREDMPNWQSRSLKPSPTGAVLNQVLDFHQESGALVVRWELDPAIVDVDEQLTVVVRYKTSRNAAMRVSQGPDRSDGSVSVELTATEGDEWCLSSAVNVTALDLGLARYAVQAQTMVDFADEVLFDSVYLAFVPNPDAQGHGQIQHNICRMPIEDCSAGSDRERCHCTDLPNVTVSSDETATFGLSDEAFRRRVSLIVAALVFGILLFACQIYFLLTWRRSYEETRTLRGMSKDDDVQSVDSVSTGFGSRPTSPKRTWIPRLTKLRANSGPEEDFDASRRAAPARYRLADILTKPKDRELFTEFVKERFAPESLFFYESIETFEQVQDARWRRDEAEAMLSRFVRPDAPYRVHLNKETQERLLNATNFPCHLFDTAKAEVYNFMQLRFLEPFVTSEAFLAPTRRSHSGSAELKLQLD